MAYFDCFNIYAEIINHCVRRDQLYSCSLALNLVIWYYIMGVHYIMIIYYT